MIRVLTTILALAVAPAALAEVHNVEMLNRGDAGSMIFEPAQLRIAVGDTVRFVASTRGHNAETDSNAWPEGVEPFVGRINEEIEVTFDTEGFYGIKCRPHYAMGMVMTVAVGDAEETPEGWLEGRVPPRAMQRYQDQVELLSEAAE